MDLPFKVSCSHLGEQGTAGGQCQAMVSQRVPQPPEGLPRALSKFPRSSYNCTGSIKTEGIQLYLYMPC